MEWLFRVELAVGLRHSWRSGKQPSKAESSPGRICVKPAVLHPLGGTLKMPNTVPSARYGDQRIFGVCNSFLEILSSYCIRKKKSISE